MSSSKFAHLEGVDYEAPDVFETNSPSPTRKTRNLPGVRGAGGYGSSDDDDDEDDDDDDSEADDGDNGRKHAQKKNKKVGQAGGRGVDGDHAAKGNGDIERTGLNVEEASKRFRDATGLDARGVDFSTSIHRRKKKPEFYPRPLATFETHTYSLGTGTGYHMTADEDELRGEERHGDPWHRVTGERETAVDKFRRLRFEMEELEKEIQRETQETTGQVENEPAGRAEEAPATLLPQLHALRENLNKLDGHGGEAHEGDDAARWQAEARKLLKGLGTSAEDPGRVQTHSSEGTKAADTESTQLSDLDRRMAGLESLVGVQDALQDEAKSLPRPLLPSLARIEHLLTLLTQPRHLDGISRRIKVLVSELERVHEARRKLTSSSSDLANLSSSGDAIAAAGQRTDGSVTLPAETLSRLDAVLPLLSKVEPLLPIVPTLLARLRSLSSLHASSAAFAHDVESIEAVLRASHTQNDELQTMLRNLEVSVTENEKRTKENLTVVEDRLEGILKRMDALAR